MKTLKEYVQEASEQHKAIGHFNFATVEMLRGIAQAAKEVGSPILVGVSEGERDFIGVRQARALVDAFRDELSIPIFLNADHTKSFDRAKEVIDAGYDAIVMDASAMAYEQNVSTVKQTIAYAKEKGRDMVVEGELGFIGTSSQILDKLPPGVPIDEAHMTKPNEAKRFVEETSVDQLAPAVGNVHGIIGAGNPHLSIKRIQEIREACGVPLVLHGASGVAEADVRDAVKGGAATVHFSTDLRVAYRKALTQSLAEFPDEVSAYKYMRDPIKAVKETVKVRLAWLGWPTV
jgi:fructose-bisphosphate aldolase class II